MKHLATHGAGPRIGEAVAQSLHVPNEVVEARLHTALLRVRHLQPTRWRALACREGEALGQAILEHGSTEQSDGDAGVFAVRVQHVGPEAGHRNDDDQHGDRAHEKSSGDASTPGSAAPWIDI